MTIPKKKKIGIICPSEIALRRFLPALSLTQEMEFVGVAVNTPEERYGTEMPSYETIQSMLQRGNIKANEMISSYGGKVFDSFTSMITSSEIDALYIPLPPALHYKWARAAINNGKHVLVEKPATLCLDDTDDLIKAAQPMGLALHENYMFQFHNQLYAIRTILNSGEIGDVRIYKITFGFPMREKNDFRYCKELGGGALFDAGGYTIKFASLLLGDTARVLCSRLNHITGFDVDMYGSGVLINDEGVTAQVAFGMDNEYRCELEIWGSKGVLTTKRVLTAPAGFTPTAIITKNGKETLVELPSDDAFQKSIHYFLQCINDNETRNKSYNEMHRQALLVKDFLNCAKL